MAEETVRAPLSRCRIEPSAASPILPVLGMKRRNHNILFMEDSTRAKRREMFASDGNCMTICTDYDLTDISPIESGSSNDGDMHQGADSSGMLPSFYSYAIPHGWLLTFRW